MWSAKIRLTSWHHRHLSTSSVWPTTPGSLAGTCRPQAFHKAASSVIGPGEAIQLSSTVGYVDPEAELTVVVGRARGGV